MVHLFILWFALTFSQVFIFLLFFCLLALLSLSFSLFFFLSLYSPKFPFPISLLPSCHHLFSITLLFCWLMLEIFQEFLIHSAMRTVIFAFSLAKVLSHGEDHDGASLGQRGFGWTLPWARFASGVVCSECGMCERKLGPWGARAGGRECALRNLKFHTTEMSTGELKHEREAGWGTSWRRVGGRAGKKIHPPPPHPSLQVFLPCRCRGAAVPALANIHWIVILRKPQTSIYPLFLFLSRVRGHL